MYLVERKIKVLKDFSETILLKQQQQSVVTKFKGFLKTEVFIDRKNNEYDVIISLIYFESKKDFYRWQGSPEHIAMHKRPNHGKKPEGVLEVSRASYDYVATINYQGE